MNGSRPCLEGLTACQGEVALELNTSQISILSTCDLVILLKHKLDLVSAQNLSKVTPLHLKIHLLYSKPTRLSEDILNMLCFVGLTVF